MSEETKAGQAEQPEQTAADAEYIRDNLTTADLYLQLAEEASELAQAACKTVRIMKGNVPTPVSLDQAMLDVAEEYADVIICARLIEMTGEHRLDTVDDTIVRKTHRLAKRIEEA